MHTISEDLTGPVVSVKSRSGTCRHDLGESTLLRL